MMAMDTTALTLLNRWQRGFPLTDTPFDDIASTLRLNTTQVLDYFGMLAQKGALSRIGAVFAPGSGGASMLAAMAVPERQLEWVAATVSFQHGVNHNYEREHHFNLWFVVTGCDMRDVEQQLHHIETATQLPVMRLPMLQAFRIDTAFDLQAEPCSQLADTPQRNPSRCAPRPLHHVDLPLAALAEQGLPLCERPYEAWAERLGCGTGEIHERLAQWLEGGVLSRFGVVVRHHEVGYRANAMVVFNVPPEHLAEHGHALAQWPGVTLVYQRATTSQWPYNLYCMVHGRDRLTVLKTVVDAARHALLEHCPSMVLFSRTRFKQNGARRFSRYLPESSGRHHIMELPTC